MSCLWYYCEDCSETFTVFSITRCTSCGGTRMMRETDEDFYGDESEEVDEDDVAGDEQDGDVLE